MEKRHKGAEGTSTVMGESERTSAAINNMMDQSLSVSATRQNASARAKFDRFLKVYRSTTSSLASLNKDDVTRELFGCFLTFLYDDKAIGWQTSMSYLSSIRRQLEG
uniref:Core-binding (CB) domain-containing protein n=1 Tax=Globisporangium ultimum (strain ATCC 200006 / CBS 805.95 / DAOM BR144) TaxID=431595 RepID=K3XBV0_GLOUD